MQNTHIQLRIKPVLKNKGKKVKWLAETIGIEQPALSSIINNKVSTSFKTIKAIADALETEVHELMVLGTGFQHAYNENSQWIGVSIKCNDKKE